MRKARELKAKAEADTVERARAWAEAKDKENADINRLADKAREKADFKDRARKNDKAVNRAGSKEREGGG